MKIKFLCAHFGESKFTKIDFTENLSGKTYSKFAHSGELFSNLAFCENMTKKSGNTLYKCQNNNKRHSRKMLASNGLKSKLLGKLVLNFKNVVKMLEFFYFQLLVGVLPVLSPQL